MDCKTEITHHFEVLSLKALVSVLAPCSPFHNTNVIKIKCSNFCTSKFLVMKSGFLHFKVFSYEVWFSALQSFCSKVHTTPHRWSSPYDVPPKFMISAQHWYTVQKKLHTERILCGCQSWSWHQILRGLW